MTLTVIFSLENDTLTRIFETLTLTVIFGRLKNTPLAAAHAHTKMY